MVLVGVGAGNFFFAFCSYIRHTRPGPITKRISAVAVLFSLVPFFLFFFLSSPCPFPSSCFTTPLSCVLTLDDFVLLFTYMFLSSSRRPAHTQTKP